MSCHNCIGGVISTLRAQMKELNEVHHTLMEAHGKAMRRQKQLEEALQAAKDEAALAQSRLEAQR